MTNLSRWIVMLIVCLGGCATVNPNLPPLETVAHVDLDRYLGRWYEIARLPTSFERDCVGVTATYSLKPDGNIRVLNACRKRTLDGPENKAEGRAWIADPNTNAKLKVSFFLWFAGDYWILDLGKNYEYAVVGDPSRQYLWFLNREPNMPEDLYAELLKRASARGFDASRVQRTLQGRPGGPEQLSK